MSARADSTRADDEALIGAQIEALRSRLIDLTNRNRMLSFTHRDGARTQLRVIDVPLEGAWQRLVSDEEALDLAALPPPPDEAADEAQPEFVLALEQRRRADPEWLTALANDPDATEAATRRLDRKLRDAVRAELGWSLFKPGRLAGSLADHAREHGIDPSYKLAVQGDSPGTLRTLLLAESLDARADAIRKQARLAEDETGASTLYAIFGFLEWTESPESDRSLLAPLLILPIEVKQARRGPRKIWQVTAGADEPSANFSLAERLARDFGLALPELEPGSDRPVQTYLDALAHAVRDRRDWRVVPMLTLSHLAFAKLAMWRDLDMDAWPDGRAPAASPLLRDVLHGPSIAEGQSLFFAEEHAIDDPTVESVAPILVHDADSSQHSAIVDAMHGKNVVVEGPPGTGKSQTITNLIANALHAGQKVLFIAEKLAALRVVKDRLDQAGLGEFCLELHAAKAKPKEVIESLQERINLRPESQPSGTASAARSTRDTLNAYAEALHRRHDETGRSAFDWIWQDIGLAGSSAPEEDLELQQIDVQDAIGWNDAAIGVRKLIVDQLTQAVQAWQASGLLEVDEILKALRCDGSNPFVQARLRSLLKAMVEGVRAVLTPLAELDAPEPEGLSLQVAASLADALAGLPRLPRLDADPFDPQLLQQLEQAHDLLELRELEACLAEPTGALADPGKVARIGELAARHRLSDAPFGAIAGLAAAAQEQARLAGLLTGRLVPVLRALELSLHITGEDMDRLQEAARHLAAVDE